MTQVKQKQTALTPDPLVQALMPEPSSPPPDATVIRGFLGKSTQPGVWRLYLTATLDRYVEIPEDRILHHMRLPDDRGTLLWVPKDMTLPLSQAQPDRIHAGFLDGAITANHIAAAGLNAFLPPALMRALAVNTITSGGQPCYNSYMGVGCPPTGGTIQ